jgi:RHS repeat-associated protein
MAKANPFRFSTKYQDDETDLLYYGYRYYNASTGRWLSRDPLEELGGIDQYEFTGNDPVNSCDLFGWMEISVTEEEVDAATLKKSNPDITGTKADTTVALNASWGTATPCPCGYANEGYKSAPTAKIRYLKPMAKTKAESAGSNTVEKHERHHVKLYEEGFYGIDNRWWAFEGMCLSLECYNARRAALVAVANYYFKKIAADNYGYDATEYRPGPNKDKLTQKAVQAASDAQRLYQLFQQAAAKANTVCPKGLEVN